jgi:hypothetical protein
MVVYVLLVGYDYEGHQCLGVYASAQLAQEAFASADWLGGYPVIEERVLGALPEALDL